MSVPRLPVGRHRRDRSGARTIACLRPSQVGACRARRNRGGLLAVAPTAAFAATIREPAAKRNGVGSYPPPSRARSALRWRRRGRSHCRAACARIHPLRPRNRPGDEDAQTKMDPSPSHACPAQHAGSDHLLQLACRAATRATRLWTSTSRARLKSASRWRDG